MKGVYIQKLSPYYWIRYYDKYDPDPKKRSKSINTKIKITPADLTRAISANKDGTKQRLQGTPELRKLLSQFRTGLAELNITRQTGVILKKELSLRDGFEEFKKDKSVPHSKQFIKEKTLNNYALSIDHFIKSAGDKIIYKYTENDFKKLLFYFDEVSENKKKMSVNTRAIYTRSLHAVWNYFIKKNYADKNIIEIVNPELKDPDPIDIDDMTKIIQHLKNDKEYPHHYFLIYYLLLTGCRASSAITQNISDIDFKNRFIKIPNVKTGRKKNKLFYTFPIYSELEKLLLEMNIKKDSPERLFKQYALIKNDYTSPLSFWDRAIRKLINEKIIKKRYLIKQIRPTFFSYLINILGMDIYSVYKLADHADMKTTETHYIKRNIDRARIELDLSNMIDVK
jgi:integrase